MPCGETKEKLPIGLQILGKHFDEATILRVAHAYEQVHATRTITVRLLRGLRRRVERGTGARATPDEAFLNAALVRAPALDADVKVVRRALREPVHDRELPAIGAALHRIEHTLTTTPS